MMAFSSAVEPLRVANRFGGGLFDWEVISVDGEPVVASNGMAVVANASINEIDFTPILIVCSSFDPQLYETKPLLSWLRRQHKQGAMLGALDTGCHILATAGLLDNYRVTLHWEAIPAFAEEFPEVEVTYKLFEIDRKRFTCAGGTAALDMVLYLIGQHHGHELAVEVSEQFIHDRIRKGSDHQKMGISLRFGLYNAKLLKAIELMENNLEEPIKLSELASQVGISRRQLERLFSSHLKVPPSEYYIKLRLERGRQLLQQSSLTVTEVAIACGFNSASSFSRTYRTKFGSTPRKGRKILR